MVLCKFLKGDFAMLDREKLKCVMGDLEEEEVYEILNEVMADGGSEAEAAMAVCQEGMEIVGERFDSGEYFVGDLVYAGEIMTEVVNILKPALIGQGEGTSAGRLILCTVEGDLHDIGKNIVRSMLEAAGFEVLDLGIDTPPAKIVETVQKENIKIVALSGVLTLALDAMQKTVKALVSAGLRDEVKVIIGGNPVSESACEAVGADAWAHSPQQTVMYCREWSK